MVLSFFIFILGLCLGSFLNVLAYRLPRDISFIFPRSRCPHCKEKISSLGLIPLIGYLIQKGKCTDCHKSISLRYPLVELFTGLGCVLIYHWWHQYPEALFLSSVLFIIAIPLSLIDIEYFILPDILTLSFVPIVWAFQAWQHQFLFSLSGSLLGAGILWSLAYVYEKIRHIEGLGMGDVKYMLIIGACLGPTKTLWTLSLASILGSFIGIILTIIQRKRLHEVMLPFGPFLGWAGFICSLIP